MVAKAILKMQCSFRFDGFTSLWNSVQIDQKIGVAKIQRVCRKQKFNFTPNTKNIVGNDSKNRFSLSVLGSRKLDELAAKKRK